MPEHRDEVEELPPSCVLRSLVADVLTSPVFPELVLCARLDSEVVPSAVHWLKSAYEATLRSSSKHGRCIITIYCVSAWALWTVHTHIHVPLSFVRCDACTSQYCAHLMCRTLTPSPRRLVYYVALS